MLHKKSSKDSRGNNLTATNTTVSRRPAPIHPGLPTPQPKIVASAGAQRPMDSSQPQNMSGASIRPSRPSGLPRSTSGLSHQRLEALAASRSPPLPTANRNRKPQSEPRSEDVPLLLDHYADHSTSPHLDMRSQIAPPHIMSKNTYGFPSLDDHNDTILGIAMPEKQILDQSQTLPRLYPELQTLRSHQSKYNDRALPSVSTFSSPSTRFTESPAPWSASTATTTPVSWPSSSPAIVQSSRVPDRKSKTVPQPTVPRSRLPKLPTVPRSDPSLKPSHSVGTDDGDIVKRARKEKKKAIVNSPAPTPPPRTSSTHRTGSRGDRRGPNSIDEALARTNVSTTPSPGKDPNSFDHRTRQEVELLEETIRVPNTAAVHASLQHSIDAAPPRPSREGTIDLGESRPAVLNSHRAGFSSQHRQLLAPAFEDVPSTLTSAQLALKNASESSFSDSEKAQSIPSRLGKFSRLALFGRRNTNASDTDKSPRKLQRRGPAAGTGHEGYGKSSRRARKAPTESSAITSDSDQSVSSAVQVSRSRSTRKLAASSRHSRSSQSDLDEFAASRLKPVVMRGGSQTTIPPASELDRPRTRTGTPEVGSMRSSMTSPEMTASAAASPSRLRSPRQQIGSRRTQASVAMPTLALRRSQRFGQDYEGFPMPAPIFTDDLTASLPVTSYDASLSSMVPSSAAPSSSVAEFYRIDPSLLKPQEKKSKRQWWNPFKKREQPYLASQPSVSYVQPESELAVSISAGPAPRSIPYYAMMESESDNNNEPVGDFLPEAVVSAPQSPELPPQHGHELEIAQNTDSDLLPMAPIRTEQTRPFVNYEESYHIQSQAVKQPRLPQVGRIPKVVSRSERQHVPSRRSFSQPFAKKLVPDDFESTSPRLLDHRFDRPHLEIHTDVLPSLPFPDAVNISAKPASAPAGAREHHTSSVQAANMELAMMQSKHSSDVSASSSSEGIISVMGPPLIPTQRELASRDQFPRVRAPSMYPGDDEIWNEYDDFIDHVMSPSRSPTLKPRLEPVNPMSRPGDAHTQQTTRPSSREKMLISEPRRAALNLPLPTTGSSPAMIPSPLMLFDHAGADEIRLRRSRIVSALHSSIDPSSPFSMREFLMDYGVQTRDSFGHSERLSASTSGHVQSVAPTATTGSQQSVRVEHTHRENALLLDAIARIKDPARESELHYASLEVSRWLSFGRVLFSPAHDEVRTLPKRNVLVIDGLGNEDWSIYCAVTYQAESAVVYDLKETWPSGAMPQQSDSQHLPANLRRAQITSLSERFPFHTAFFSAVVLRFPPAMPEAKMRNIVNECRRTLVPGGHLEIMLLDLDIVNMGVQSRRAVRELKMSMATADPDVSLKPGIDSLQTILGGGGFTGFNRCVVGVPVVGRASGSVDSASSSGSSRGSTGLTRQPADSTSGVESKHRAHNFSLNELVADHSDRADARIGRMVSACARSWWQHCFEATVIPDGDLSRSIFADKRILQECKSRASSFKLLIAYAQRPVFETRRRTMSEPAAPSLATAGPGRRSKFPVE